MFHFARRLFERFHLKMGTRVGFGQLRCYHVSSAPMLFRDTSAIYFSFPSMGNHPIATCAAFMWWGGLREWTGEYQ
jgi:hypothetical protein